MSSMLTNSNQIKRDKREWTILSLFRQSFSSFPLGDVQKRESPDFVVSHPLKSGKVRKIGIELTELKYERNDTGFNMRAHEDFLCRIMEEAESFFSASHDVVLNVDVHFADSIAPLIVGDSAHDQAEFLRVAMSQTIARIVDDNLPEATGKCYRVDRSSKYGDLNLPQHIDSIVITNVSGRLESPLWYASISTRVKPLSIESVAQRIKDKDQKLAHYDKSCSFQWLVIIQNSFLMSSAYDPVVANRALVHRYRTHFDRVFVFERSQSMVHELNLIHK